MKFALDEQQRDFAASIDAALGAADLPAAVHTAPGRKVWEQLANLGVTALAVPEKFDGIEAEPIDLVVAIERLGRWCVPGPVVESIAVAPVLLAGDEHAERCAALASGELIASTPAAGSMTSRRPATAGRRTSGAATNSARWPPLRNWSVRPRHCATRRSTTPSSAPSSAG